MQYGTPPKPPPKSPSASRYRPARRSTVAALALLSPLVWATAAIPAPATRHDGELPGARALRDHLARAGAPPAVVLVSLPGCGYCKIVREQHLRSIVRDGEAAGVAVFEIGLLDTETQPGGFGTLRALDGGDRGPAESARALARAFGVRMAPTIMFLGNRSELAEPLIGYAGDDFYWAYLSARIETARRAAVTR